MALLEKCPEASFEDGRECVDRNEEPGIGFAPGAVGRESAAGDQEVDVGIKG